MAEKRAFLETFNSLSPQMKGALIGGLVGAGGGALFGKRKNMLQNMLMFGGLGAAGGYGLGHMYRSMQPNIPGMGGLAKGVNDAAGAASKVLPAAAIAAPAAMTGNMAPAMATARGVMGGAADLGRGVTSGIYSMVPAFSDASKWVGRSISADKIRNTFNTANQAFNNMKPMGAVGRANAFVNKMKKTAPPMHAPAASFPNLLYPSTKSQAAPGYLD